MAHAQQFAHFLGAIADKIWQKSPGSFILIGIGAVARAALAQHLQQAQISQSAVEVRNLDLTDFSVRQVTLDMMDQLSGGVVTRLSKEAQKSPGPIAIPGHQLRHVVLLTDEYDELRATRLVLLPGGTLQVSVADEQYHQNRSFEVKGAIDLKKLLEEYAVPVAA